MASLASKDSYVQMLASKVCAQPSREPRNRPFVPFRSGGDAGPPKKKNRGKQKNTQGKHVNMNKTQHQKPPLIPFQKAKTSTVKNGFGTKEQNVPEPKVHNGMNRTQKKPEGGTTGATFSTVDILRQRLHEKIEESRGQGAAKDPSSEAVQAKRTKRKLERERKKRKRKGFLMKKLAEKAGEELAQEIKQEDTPVVTAPVTGKRDETAIVFNKVEMVEEVFVSKEQKKKDKKKSVKGNLTPLTGKNYKQLLGRVEARKAKLEHLRETNEKKAKVLEEKMKWTNVLYKAEGLKIKDDENLLRTSLKRKEKMRSQRKIKWTERSETVVQKMQHRQDKRRRNILKRKKGNVEKKKERARKKGRVLPQDLKKAAL
ncbi:surfeit locus protein 6 [Osmerus mordax]|uniref:surfeit locus protein 6 n=1 Tax=Osmerus mordax TaxID=8014 RepID=UPI003510B62D